MLGIPNELKELNQWCVWSYENCTKVPRNPLTGTGAKSNDTSTWVSFDEAYELSKHFDGIGFFFANGYMGVDLDDIGEDIERYLDGDTTDNIVTEFYDGLKSYGEISPSESGIHIILKGSVPGDRRRSGNVEMYDSGRFFTMTGKTLGKYKEINDTENGALDRLYTKHLKSNKVLQFPKVHGVTHNLTESEVISRIRDSKNSDKFNDLMRGKIDGYDSQSEADLALCNLLAFWTANDFDQIDSIFRQSGLMRDKWDEKRGKTTYGIATINRAIADTNNTYEPAPEKPLYKFGEIFGNGSTVKEYPVRSYDDTGNAQRMIDRYGEDIKYSFLNNKFYIYDGSVWEEDNRGQIWLLVNETIEDLKNEKVIVTEDVDEEKAIAALQSHIKSSRSTNWKKKMLEQVRPLVSIVPAEDFDQDGMLLNAENGYIDLTNGTLHPHDKELMFSKKADVEYSATANCDTWIDFLNDIFDGNQDLIEFVQKAIGYSLTASNKEQKMFILLGDGRNGKSLFLNTIYRILGSYAKNMQANSLKEKKNDQINNDIARLEGARFVTSSEPNEGFVFDEGLIKQMTGDEAITARYLHQENFEFEASFKVWLATNHRPVVKGNDDGIWRRLVVIPFEVQIPEHKVDKDLKHKLMRESDGIINWAVAGAVKWQREGLELPDKVIEANEAYRVDMDPTEKFIEERCVLAGQVQSSLLHEEYIKWAKKRNEYEYTLTKFGRIMGRKFEKKKSGGVNVYVGIDLKENYDPRFGFIG